MHRIKITLYLIFAYGICSNAQLLPPICGNPSLMTPTCLEACLICDINGFTGRNTSPVRGELPPGFCTRTKHNGQWIGFMAGTSDITLDFSVFNCRDGTGLEVGVYEGIDCKNYRLVSHACNGDIRENTTFRLNMINLKVGQHYYFVMDGNGGDMCDYRVSVVSGSTKVNPLSNSGIISGPNQICKDENIIFQVSDVIGAIKYEWKVDGIIIGTGKSINFGSNQPGIYRICVQASNACDIAPSTCFDLIVNPKSYDYIEPVICEGSCFQMKDTMLCSVGRHRIKYQNFFGCDSIVEVELKNQLAQNTVINRRACEGDSITIAKETYTQGGSYMQVLQTYLGCDSVLQINLNFIVCDIKGSQQAENLKCHNDKSGILTFSVIQGTPPFNYIVEKLPNIAIANGIVTNIGQQIRINNLEAGAYSITITDNFGNQRIIFQNISQPEPLLLTSAIDTYNSYNISCNGGSDGRIHLSTSGGTKPYQYVWSNNAQDSIIDKLKAGDYSVTVTDDNDCPQIVNFTLSEPLPLNFSTKISHPSCTEKNIGSIELFNFQGAVSPFEISIDGSPFTKEYTLNKLTSGYYRFTIRDQNNCLFYFDTTLVDPEHLLINPIPDLTIELGDSLNIEADIEGNIKSLLWSPSTYLLCSDCSLNRMRPIYDIRYKLLGISKDGCIDSISFFVTVLKNRNIFPPNIFSPNGDQINDYFNLFGTKQIRNIKSLKVFTRWGELVYHGENLTVGNSLQGWNGKIRNESALPGVYVWTAEVEFHDDYNINLSGDINLIR